MIRLLARCGSGSALHHFSGRRFPRWCRRGGAGNHLPVRSALGRTGRPGVDDFCHFVVALDRRVIARAIASVIGWLEVVLSIEGFAPGKTGRALPVAFVSGRLLLLR